jgi:pimeloyl-ACP methyl ester carboxylesterase
MTEGFFESRGIAYRTNDFKEGRPTLVFIHGLSGSCSAWYPYEEKFEKKYNLLTFDLRGHGLSKRWLKLGDYVIAASVADIEALMKHTGIERATIVGHSLGTSIALAFFEQYRARVTSLILLAPTMGLHNLLRVRATRPFIAGATALLHLMPASIRAGTRIDYKNYPNTRDFDVRRMFTDIKNTGLHVYFYFLQHLYARADDNAGDAISVPLLVVHGEQDSYVPVSFARRFALSVPHATIVALADANHILVLNNVDEVSQAIEHFLI